MYKLRAMLSAIFILCSALHALAQAPEGYDKVEVFVGYSHTKIDAGLNSFDGVTGQGDDRASAHGFEFAVTRNFNKYVGFKLDTSGHYASPTHTFCVDSDCQGIVTHSLGLSRYNLLGGAQFKNNSKDGSSLRPFAHVLVGAARTRVGDLTTETKLAGAIGGGLDLRVSPRYDLRVFQADYNPIRTSNAPNNESGRATYNLFRVGFGVVFR